MKTGATLAALLLLAAALPGQSGKDRQPVRSVQGIVTDMQENPLVKAVVQLKNTKNLQVKSFYTDEKGAYRFHGLDPDTDYELKAEYNQVTSPARTLSSFDSRKQAVMNFKLDVKQ